MKSITLGERNIGNGQPVYLIAEVGTTCLGNLETALELVKAGAAAGVDAVKFQIIDPSQLSDESVTYPVERNGRIEQINMHEMFSRLVFSKEIWCMVKEACDAHEVDFFATVDYVAGVDLLEEIGVPAHKLGAWDCTFRPLIEKMGSTGKPMMVDLGPTSQEEIDDIVSWYLGAGGSSVVFLHDYHTDDDLEMNMAAIRHLDATQPWPVGYSSPGHDHDLDFLALGMGATVIEKRLIMDRSQQAFHAHESLEPDELHDWVLRIRHGERAIGARKIRPSRKDLEGREKYYRSICTQRPIQAGEVFNFDNLNGKRPGSGIPTSRLREFWGKRATRNLGANELIGPEDAA